MASSGSHEVRTLPPAVKVLQFPSQLFLLSQRLIFDAFHLVKTATIDTLGVDNPTVGVVSGRCVLFVVVTDVLRQSVRLY